MKGMVIKMKISKIIIALLLTLLMLATAASCALMDQILPPKDDESTAEPVNTADAGKSAMLVGVWEEIDIDNIYTFKADGTGDEYYDGTTWKMTWVLNGNILTMDFPETGVEEYEIYLTNDRLVVHNEDIDFEYVREGNKPTPTPTPPPDTNSSGGTGGDVSGNKSGTGGDTGSGGANALALIGMWDEIDIDNIYTFNADGTGTEYFDGTTWVMTWELNGNVLTMNFPETGVEVYEITLRGDELIVHNPDIDFEYVRMGAGTSGGTSGGGRSTSSSIVGVWDEIDIDNTYTFNADGTGKEYFDGTTWKMTWVLDGDWLTMDFPETGVEEYRITLDGDWLVVHNPDIDFEYVRR